MVCIIKLFCMHASDAIGACVNTNSDKNKQNCIVGIFDEPSNVLDKPLKAENQHSFVL